MVSGHGLQRERNQDIIDNDINIYFEYDTCAVRAGAVVAVKSATTPRCENIYQCTSDPIPWAYWPQALIESVHLFLTLSVVGPVPAGPQHERDSLRKVFAGRKLANLHKVVVRVANSQYHCRNFLSDCIIEDNNSWR